VTGHQQDQEVCEMQSAEVVLAGASWLADRAA
jgi:hypothetical protein